MKRLSGGLKSIPVSSVANLGGALNVTNLISGEIAPLHARLYNKASALPIDHFLADTHMCGARTLDINITNKKAALAKYLCPQN